VKKGMGRESVLLLIISLVLSVMLWLQVDIQSEPNSQREFEIPLDIRNVPEGFMVVRSARKVKVVAEGAQSALQNLKTEQFSAYCDVDEKTSVKQRLALQMVAPTRLPVKISMRDTYTDIQLARIIRIEQKVVLEARGTVPNGVVFQGATVNPEVVSVTGPEDAINQVSEVRAVLELSQVDSGKTITAAIEVLNKDLKPVANTSAEPNTVSILPGVVAAPSESNVLVTPNYEGNPAPGYVVESITLIPNQVKITGESSAVARVRTIETQNISLEGIDKDKTTTVGLRLPRGIKVKSNSKISAVIRIRKLPTSAPQPNANPGTDPGGSPNP